MDNKIRIRLTIQIWLGLLIGIGLFIHEKQIDNQIPNGKAILIQEFCDATKLEYENNSIFINVNRQNNNISNNKNELLAKSKKEKILVTGDN